MIIAEIYTDTMIFKALGATQGEAERAILTEWNKRQKHMAEIGYKEPHYFKTTGDMFEEYGEPEITEIEPGQCIAY